MGGNLDRGRVRVLAVVLFAVVSVLVVAVGDPVQAPAVLFVVPVALLALSDGVRGGYFGALIATAVFGTWALVEEVDLNVLGWASRITAFFVIGLMVGRFEDVVRSHERGRMDERYAQELHDRVVQSLIVARYQLHDNGASTEAVDRALAAAKDLISERLGDVEPGDLRLSSS